MSLEKQEMEARSRIADAARLLCNQRGIELPTTLTSRSGDRRTRRVKHLAATAEVLEALALEDIQSGLAEKLGALGYTSLAVLRQTDDADLLAIDGVGRKTVEALRKAIDPVSQAEKSEETDDLPDFEEIVAEISGESDDGPEEG